MIRALAASARIRTMEEFSVASGISRPTLSRFFNDPGRVRPATRQKIEAAMDRLGYRPNLFAVNFNRRNPKTVGIIVPTLLDPFYAALVQRIEFQASAAGYWTVIQSSQGDPDREAEAVATLVSTKSAGAVVAPSARRRAGTYYRQMEKAMPLVFLDARVDADASIRRNRQPFSIGLMVDYLLRSGAPPSYFDMPAVNQNASERRQAYEASMIERGAEPVIFDVPSLDWDFERLAFRRGDAAFQGWRSGWRNNPMRLRPGRIRRDGGCLSNGHICRPPGGPARCRPRRSPFEPIRLPLADDGRAGC